MLKRKPKPLPRLTLKKTNQKALKKLALAIVITVFAAGLYTKVAPHTHEAKQRVLLQKTIQQLEDNKKQLQDQKSTDVKKIDELNKQLEETQKQLEAKRNTPKVYAEPAPAPAPVVTYGGSCDDWIIAAGISDVATAHQLIAGESGCNPYAVNSSSGACGVAQELPCGKSGCALGDGACQVRWMNSYVVGRYGSWGNAWATWNARYPHWY